MLLHVCFRSLDSLKRSVQNATMPKEGKPLMNRRTQPQLPGDVLIALRSSEGFANHRAFAETLPMSDSTLWRMETVTWGTSPAKWQRKMNRDDLKVICKAGWCKEGDAWWEQFITAFAWQYLVEKYGEEIYADEGASLRILAPISEEHVLAMVEALVTREVIRRAATNNPLDEAGAQPLIDKISAETIFRLSTMDRILTKESSTPITPDAERTRALSDLLATDGVAETAYTRTLLFAYEWISDLLGR